MKLKILDWRILLVLAAVFAQPQPATPQSASSTVVTQSSAANAVNVPDWLPFPIPPKLYEKWRKYGEWDYKQQSFKYRDFTLFNFGATGGAAGLDQNSLQVLARASKPTPDDVERLGGRELETNFNRDPQAFETVRSMVEQDAHVIRIAPDFTWLENNTKWPREDVGFSESRWNEYRSLFNKLSIPEGILRSQDFPGAIFFIAQVRGLCTGGSSAGYVYSPKTLAPAVKSPTKALDEEARKNPSKHYAYVFKPLKANWYTFYEVDW